MWRGALQQSSPFWGTGGGQIVLNIFCVGRLQQKNSRAPRPSLRDSPHRCNETNPHASKTLAALKGSKPDWSVNLTITRVDSIGRCNTRSTPTCRELKGQNRLIQTKTLPCLGLHRL